MRKTFPWPFSDGQNSYAYSNNTFPIPQAPCVTVDYLYIEEMKVKRDLLQSSEERCFKALPHMKEAQYEAAMLVADHLSSSFNKKFTTRKSAEAFTLTNHLLHETICVTKECESPLKSVGEHVQEDLILMYERDQNIHLDAGLLCFPAGWSLTFNLGMPFIDIHSPVPGLNSSGLDSRIIRFLKGLDADLPFERINWSLAAGNRLDHSLETSPYWKKDRKKVTAKNAGHLVHLRVEVQRLFRLPSTQAILFTIRTYLKKIENLTAGEMEQLYTIVRELPGDIKAYKGITEYETPLFQYLQEEIRRTGSAKT
ncbi:heme-dependent oxidative N-demethylase family protein [Alteribacter lacisalsi]|nr:DUF3445 domain-containing protein [Alteribacter lacisalsi]